MFGRWSSPQLGAPHARHRASRPRPEASPSSSAPFVHMATPLYLQKRSRRDRRSARRAHARGRSHRLPGVDRQHPGELGEMGAKACASSCARARTTSAAPHGREHLARRGCEPRAGHDRAGFAAVVHPRRPLVQRTTLYSRVPVASPCERRRHHRATSLVVPRSSPRERPDPSPRGRFRAHHQWPSASSSQAELLRSMLATVWELGREARAPATSRSPTQPLPRWPRPSGCSAPTARCASHMFGSARTKPADPVYLLARTWPAIAAAGWMVVTGAGPGIMAAGSEARS